MSEIDTRSQQRKLQRHLINDIVEVYDTQHDHYLGRLVNIHAEGLMVMGDSAVEVDRLYQLALQLPKPINGRDLIHIGVDCLWVKESDDHNKHWSGFYIIDKSVEAEDDINRLVQLLEESANSAQ
ncbi:MAG: PilZ domain-containing protein [Exilibacterium sp.]